MQARKGRSVYAYKTLLNFYGKAFLLKLPLHEQLWERRGVDGTRVSPSPHFWLRPCRLPMHKLASVALGKAPSGSRGAADQALG